MLTSEQYISAINIISSLTSEDNHVATDISSVRWCFENRCISSFGSVTEQYSNSTDIMLIVLKAIREYQCNEVMLKEADSIVVAITTGMRLSFSKKEMIVDSVSKYISAVKEIDLIAMFEADALVISDVKVTIVGMNSMDESWIE